MSSSLAKRLFVLGGAPALVRSVKRSRLRILMYHRFPGEASSVHHSLCAQFAHLRKHYHPIALSEAVSSIASGRPLPERALAITVDDGYGDFLKAWPLFRAFQLPVTLYVVSGFLDQALWLWPDVIQFCLRHAQRASVELTLPRGKVGWPIERPEQRRIAETEIGQELIALPNTARVEIVREFPDILDVKLPSGIPAEYASLTWDALREMSQQGLDVGAHTQTHPIVARLETEEKLVFEILGSKAVIESRLARPVHQFCYPNGTLADFNETCQRVVRKAGFLGAVSAIRGLNGPESNIFGLRRIGVDPARDPETFALEAAGFRM